MKILSVITATAIAATAMFTTTDAKANTLGAFKGIMQTEMLGDGDIVGGMFEFEILPQVSIQFRGAYADSFEELDDVSGMIDELSTVIPDLNYWASYYNLDAYSVELENFCIVPLELGLIARVPLPANPVTFYAGGGVGYYVIPAFDVIASGGFSAEEDIDNIFGYWGLVGVEAGIPNLCVFAEAKYTDIAEESLEFDVDMLGYKGTLSADIDLSGMTYLVGVRLKW